MKNTPILITFFILLIVSCSSDSKENDMKLHKLTPPEWLIGSWVEDDSKEQEYTGEFIFKPDNVIYLMGGEIYRNYQTYLISHPYVDVEIKEIINTNEIYELTVKVIKSYGPSNYIRLTWTKINNAKMKYENNVADCPECTPTTEHYSKK